MREPSASVFDFLAKDVSAAGSFHSRKSGTKTAHGEVLFAVDAGGRPTLLVPMGTLVGAMPDWHSKSLSLQTLELAVDSGKRPFTILRCLDPKLHHQFGLLADDVLDVIESNPDKASSAVTATLDRWRNLFEAERGSLLGAAQLAGIMAELLVLEQLAESRGPKALSAWQGPKGHRHDFVLSDCSIEVKATTNHNNMVVTIHGGRQLAQPDHGELYLRAFQLERTPVGTSVPGKIAELLELGLSRLDLLTALEGAHYSDADASTYEETKFSVLSEKSYLVGKAFPRITPETVMPPEIIDRLSSIAYSLDLGQLEEASLSLKAVLLADAGPS
ncbi:PD-(D/E)XK motif protein [Pseudarthrobacter sp. LMD1-1-1.1]|uniref:PD-(D/E)XK motif protein n=1 Tax=Pseudarthrobacter sp. LMD1-1-1.1 TaxID=3135242 RepID=UPI0034270A38